MADTSAKGWSVSAVGDILDLKKDGIKPTDFPDEVFDHYSIPAYDEGRRPAADTGESVKSGKYVVPEGCVMISKLNPRIPRVWLPVLHPERRSISSTEFLVSVPRDVSREYVYGLYTSSAFMDEFAGLVTGTSGSHQRVKPEYLLAMKVVKPSPDCIEAFAKLVRPLHERTSLNVQEVKTLAAARDALLPKLLSGDIRVTAS